MPTVNLDSGVKIHYEDDDFSDPWSTSEIVLLHHGFGRSAKFWYAWVPILAEHFRVIRVDARGFGQSIGLDDPVASISLENFISDICGVMDHLGAEKVHYGGESLGGIIGSAFAARHPERVASLTLVAATTVIPQKLRDIYKFEYESWVDAMHQMGVESWARRANVARFTDDVDPRLPEWYAQQIGKNDVELLSALVTYVATINVESELPAIQAPTLLLYPDKGILTGGAQSNIFATTVPNSRMVTIPHQSHQIFTTHPKECAREMRDFILALDAVKTIG